MIFKRLFCDHSYKFIRNIHGQEIVFSGYKRSVEICTKCGSRKWNSYLIDKKNIRKQKIKQINDKIINNV